MFFILCFREFPLPLPRLGLCSFPGALRASAFTCYSTNCFINAHSCFLFPRLRKSHQQIYLVHCRTWNSGTPQGRYNFCWINSLSLLRKWLHILFHDLKIHNLGVWILFYQVQQCLAYFMAHRHTKKEVLNELFN